MRPDLYQLFAESKGVPPGWKWHGWSTATDDVPDGFLRLKGCVPSGVYTRGPRKGRPNFSKPVPGSERVLFINLDELEAFTAEWERTTGLCRHCGDTGLKWNGWSAAEGNSYIACNCGRKPVVEQTLLSACE